MKTKKCSSCQEIKNVNFFTKNSSRKDGLHTECRECKKQIGIKWRAENTEKIKQRRPAKQLTIQHKFTLAKYGANRRRLIWNIDFDEYARLCLLPCAYCEEFFQTSGSGLDRVDSSQGYLLTNVVPCCKRCNFVFMAERKDKIFTHIAKMLFVKMKNQQSP